MKQTVVKSILLEIIYKINLLTVINLSMPLSQMEQSYGVIILMNPQQPQHYFGPLIIFLVLEEIEMIY